MSIKEKILLLRYYNPTIKIDYNTRRIWRNKKWETQVILKPKHLWKVIDRM